MLHFAKLILDLEESVSSDYRQIAIENYLLIAPPSDQLWAIWLIRGNHPKRIVSLEKLRIWAEGLMNLPGWLIQEGQEQVGDLVEAISIMLPKSKKLVHKTLDVSLAYLENLRNEEEQILAQNVADLWMRTTPEERFIWNKLMTGTFRLKIPDIIIAKALSEVYLVEHSSVIANLQSDWSPQGNTIDILIDANRPTAQDATPYQFEAAQDCTAIFEKGEITDWLVQEKYRGLSCQIVLRNARISIWFKGENLITAHFPEFMEWPSIITGNYVFLADLVAFDAEGFIPSVDLHSRLNKKSISRKIQRSSPTTALLFDLLEMDGRDITSMAFVERIQHLKRLMNDFHFPNARFVDCFKTPTWNDLKSRHQACRSLNLSGILITHKSFTSPGLSPGLRKFVKTAPLKIVGVLLYVKSSQGGRGGTLEEFTIAIRATEGLVPLVRVKPQLNQAQLSEFQQFIYDNTYEKFGPVRSVNPIRKCILQFDDLLANKRRKSGLVLIQPKVLKWLPDSDKSEVIHIEEIKSFVSKSKDR